MLRRSRPVRLLLCLLLLAGGAHAAFQQVAWVERAVLMHGVEGSEATGPAPSGVTAPDFWGAPGVASYVAVGGEVLGGGEGPVPSLRGGGAGEGLRGLRALRIQKGVALLAPVVSAVPLRHLLCVYRL